jgi:putative FmdB family regulatory protein
MEKKMPLYEYKCKECDKTFEVLQKIKAEPLTKCLHCQGDVEKLVSISSFQFKGSGWYITDYKNKNKSSKPDKAKNQVSNNKGSNKNASINK